MNVYSDIVWQSFTIFISASVNLAKTSLASLYTIEIVKTPLAIFQWAAPEFFENLDNMQY